MNRFPSLDLYSVWLALTDLLTAWHKSPRFTLYDLDIIAIASETVDTTISDNGFTTLKGVIQIYGTTSDIPAIEIIDIKTAHVSYSFDANTTGKQHYRFLLIGY